MSLLSNKQNNLYKQIGMCVGPLMAGYLYASIGFFWLCTVLCTFFFCFIPLAYFFIGDSRQLIPHNTKKEVEEVEVMIDEKVVRVESNLSSVITVAVLDLNSNINTSNINIKK